MPGALPGRPWRARRGRLAAFDPCSRSFTTGGMTGIDWPSSAGAGPTDPTSVIGGPARRSVNRTVRVAGRRRRCAHSGRSGAPRRSPKADVRPSVAIAARMSLRVESSLSGITGPVTAPCDVPSFVIATLARSARPFADICSLPWRQPNRLPRPVYRLCYSARR
jgi:hypothetical protein